MPVSRSFTYKGPFPWRCSWPCCCAPVRAGEQAVSILTDDGRLFMQHGSLDGHTMIPLEEIFPLPEGFRALLSQSLP